MDSHAHHPTGLRGSSFSIVAGNADNSIESEHKLVEQFCTQNTNVASRKGTYWRIVTPLVGIAAVIGVATYVLCDFGRQTTSDAYLEGPIVRISSKVSGQVITLNVNNNTPVIAGDILFEIDPTDYQAKVDQANAALLAAESSVLQAEAQVIAAEAMIGQTEAGLKSTESSFQQKESDYKRYAAMGTEGISAQRLDTAKSTADSAAADRDAANERLAAAQATLTVAHSAIGVAKAQVTSAQAQLHLVTINLEWTKVIAPTSGRVTQRNVEAGAFVSTGQPLFAIVPDELWVLANFKEVQLSRMRPGQRVDVRVDAYPDRHMTGRVQSKQAGTGARFELLPPENATGNWVKIVQRVPIKIIFDPGQHLDDLTQGMSAEVIVDTNERDNSAGGAP